jgi:hypothetical protein
MEQPIWLTQKSAEGNNADGDHKQYYLPSPHRIAQPSLEVVGPLVATQALVWSSAVGAPQVSPARKGWEPIPSTERRRCVIFLLAIRPSALIRGIKHFSLTPTPSSLPSPPKSSPAIASPPTSPNNQSSPSHAPTFLPRASAPPIAASLQSRSSRAHVTVPSAAPACNMPPPARPASPQSPPPPEAPPPQIPRHAHRSVAIPQTDAKSPVPRLDELSRSASQALRDPQKRSSLISFDRSFPRRPPTPRQIPATLRHAPLVRAPTTYVRPHPLPAQRTPSPAASPPPCSSRWQFRRSVPFSACYCVRLRRVRWNPSGKFRFLGGSTKIFTAPPPNSSPAATAPPSPYCSSAW